jgi:biopolymer transport protein TolQ
MAIISMLQNQAAVESSFYYLIRHSSLPAKCVLFILLFFSIASWAIIYTKYRSLRRAKQQSDEFLRFFRQCPQLSEALAVVDQFKQSPIASAFLCGYQQVTDFTDQNTSQEGGVPATHLKLVERSLKRATLVETARMEQGLSWLASTATASPFIGLFGTVIGIILAFQGLSTQSETSIQAVAPGIAEALVATAFGLFAAIPAYIAYNQYINQVRRLAREMEEFTLEFLNVVERSLTQYGVYRS